MWGCHSLQAERGQPGAGAATSISLRPRPSQSAPMLPMLPFSHQCWSGSRHGGIIPCASYLPARFLTWKETLSICSQVMRLCNSLKREAAPRPLMIMIDQEGGKVRLRTATPPPPSAARCFSSLRCPEPEFIAHIFRSHPGGSAGRPIHRAALVPVGGCSRALRGRRCGRGGGRGRQSGRPRAEGCRHRHEPGAVLLLEGAGPGALSPSRRLFRVLRGGVPCSRPPIPPPPSLHFCLPQSVGRPL